MTHPFLIKLDQDSIMNLLMLASFTSNPLTVSAMGRPKRYSSSEPCFTPVHLGHRSVGERTENLYLREGWMDGWIQK